MDLDTQLPIHLIKNIQIFFLNLIFCSNWTAARCTTEQKARSEFSKITVN